MWQVAVQRTVVSIITNFEQTADGSNTFFEMLPQHTQEALDNYLLDGYEPGGFLTAVIVDDWDTALRSADFANKSRFWYVCTWVREIMPKESIGSHQKIKDWCRDKDGIRSAHRDQAEKDYEWRTLSGEIEA